MIDLNKPAWAGIGVRYGVAWLPQVTGHEGNPDHSPGTLIA